MALIVFTLKDNYANKIGLIFLPRWPNNYRTLRLLSVFLSRFVCWVTVFYWHHQVNVCSSYTAAVHVADAAELRHAATSEASTRLKVLSGRWRSSSPGKVSLYLLYLLTSPGSCYANNCMIDSKGWRSENHSSNSICPHAVCKIRFVVLKVGDLEQGGISLQSLSKSTCEWLRWLACQPWSRCRCVPVAARQQGEGEERKCRRNTNGSPLELSGECVCRSAWVTQGWGAVTIRKFSRSFIVGKIIAIDDYLVCLFLGLFFFFCIMSFNNTHSVLAVFEQPEIGESLCMKHCFRLVALARLTITFYRWRPPRYWALLYH